MPMDGLDIKVIELVNEAFEAWLQLRNRRRDQVSIESFAAEKTKAGTETFHGLDQLRLITTLGGRKPFGYG